MNYFDIANSLITFSWIVYLFYLLDCLFLLHILLFHNLYYMSYVKNPLHTYREGLINIFDKGLFSLRDGNKFERYKFLKPTDAETGLPIFSNN